jgi:hypothetical protein
MNSVRDIEIQHVAGEVCAVGNEEIEVSFVLAPNE